ncbi:tRNA (adenosine(37)-N6)-threonylcarbamoyltransferase complex ATPase subunit type 1 TsaE [Dokdonia sp. Hel_I_53]|uniref:tRNA (adenosine(37)-N6)-threonylcarbamoyltransferase complex ATPase subunit type 1 TsaE n=1 Tax=Dokdonia sp. Hel_I_53 TaxID=1566287 RepID=UPI00119B3A90|nr:tRNA (adenosine(37)-N6)-threonylcarbamoyltransferase complex ATPase subunit type 1 TsaE [Dokdonia sp. Hel_I_53]TVZ51060.1 tRNA threonylcarbamoyladenosine biosynthesis protein TsaE [Dokdonia sp. Hel_I_53]
MQTTYTLSQIDQVAKEIITKSKSKTLLFYGEMGAGKTTLIKSILKQLGVEASSSSPTFSIVNEHVSNTGEQIYHFDFYRIKQEEEALDIGFEEYIYQGDWIFIEWPEKIRNYIPKDSQSVSMMSINERERAFELN